MISLWLAPTLIPDDFAAVILPVASRELLVRARAPGTFHVRLAAAGILSLFLGGIGLTMATTGGKAMGGSVLFGFLSYLLMLFCLIEGVRNTAGGISDERRDGTLGFLFLTNLSSLDVLLGKLAGAALNSFYVLLAFLPVVSVAVLLGGVTGGEMFRLGAALPVALLLALACGAWGSVRCRDTMFSLLTGFGLLLLFLFGGVLVDLALAGAGQLTLPGEATFSLTSPAMSLLLAGDTIGPPAHMRFWWSLTLQLLLVAGVLFHAAHHLRRTWRREENRSADAGTNRDKSTRPASHEAVSAGVNRRLVGRRWWVALVALSLVGGLGHLTPWLMGNATATTGATVMMLPILQLPLALASYARFLLVIYLVARSLGEARHTGELEILLTTPLAESELLTILWRRLKPMLVALVLIDFGLAAASALAAEFLAPASAVTAGGVTFNFSAWQWVSVFQNLVYRALQWWATGWAALWFGLSSRRTAAAVGTTFGLVVIATSAGIGMASSLIFMPLFFLNKVLGFTWLPPVAVLIISALTYGKWIQWSRQRLLTRFRPTVSETTH